MGNQYNSRIQNNGLRVLLHVALICYGIYCLIGLFPQNHTRPARPQIVEVKPQPRVGTVIISSGDGPIYERAIKTHEEHSARHGHPLYMTRTPILESFGNKLAILQSIILEELQKPVGRRLQWLFSMDGDSVLMNPNIPLDVFIPPPQLTRIRLVLSEDWNQTTSGVFAIRVHPWSVEFLSAAIAYPIINSGAEDQSAMKSLIDQHEYFSRSVTYCPLRWFNSYMSPDSPAALQVRPGDLLVQFPVTPNSDLEQTMEYYLDIAEEHRPDWELPLQKTRHIGDTFRFWDEVDMSISPSDV